MEKDNIKISVVIPCYNVEKYIDDCLKSVLNQTFKDYEVICVNDGSLDNTLEKLKKYDVKIINQENKGVSAARNLGVLNSKGDYIAFIDSDDWVDSNYLEKLYLSITKNDCDIALCSIIRKRPKSQKYRMHFTEEKVYSSLQEKLDVSKIPNCCYVMAKLYKKSLIENKPFKQSVYYEDVLWLPEIIKEAEKIVVVPETYYYYRVSNNSIVKSTQSLKKQHDSFFAKSKVIKFYKENNLVLNEKNKNLTKYITYFYKIPLIRIKEYKGIETTYLFGFLPIFKKSAGKYYYRFKGIKKLFLLRKLDHHLYINFLGLHLSFKIKDKFKYVEVKKSGVTKQKRSPELIVSLTSYPARINTIHKTINTLLNQTLKPDRLILWLTKEQFENTDLPKSLTRLQEYGLEIRWYKDLRSYKKLVPALKEFPNDIIITADDDLYYQKDWLESLYSAYLQNPKYIYTRRASGIANKANRINIVPHYANNHYQASYTNQLMGGAGTLYPPNSLHSDIFDEDKIKNLVPTYDDIYFWAMAILKGTKIALVKNKDLNFYYVENTQNEGLCKINISPEEAFNKVFEEYPEIISLIEEKD